MVRGAVRQTSGASYLALSPDVHRELINAIRAAAGNSTQQVLTPVILAPMDIRRFMRKIIERDFPEFAVLSYQELTASAKRAAARSHQDHAADQGGVGRGGGRRTQRDAPGLWRMPAGVVRAVPGAGGKGGRRHPLDARGAIGVALTGLGLAGPATSLHDAALRLGAVLLAAIALYLPVGALLAQGETLAGAIKQGMVWPQILACLFASRLLAETNERRFARFWRNPAAAGGALRRNRCSPRSHSAAPSPLPSTRRCPSSPLMARRWRWCAPRSKATP